MLNTWGVVNTFGVYQAYYQAFSLSHASASTISWIGSLQACLLFLVGLVTGPLFDAGYFMVTLSLGLFFVCFGMFMTSLCTKLYQVILAQGICVGVGMGLLFLPATGIMAQYFSKRRALAVGIAGTGSPVGGIIFPIVFSHLYPHIGFGWATRVIAFILLGLSAVPLVFMRPRLPPTGHVRSLVDKTALRDIAYITFIAGLSFVFLVLYVAYFYIQVYTEVKHLSSPEFTPYTVTLLNAGSVIGRILPMYIGDKIGVVNVAIFCCLGSAILAFGWMGIHNLGGVVVFTLLYGITSGAVVVGGPVAIMALSPNMALLGTRMGMAFGLTGISVLVGTPIAGAILGDFSHKLWLAGIGYSAGGLIVGTSFMIWAWVLIRERRETWKI